MKISVIISAVLVIISIGAAASVKVRMSRTGSGYTILSVEKTERTVPGQSPFLVRSIPYFLSEDPNSSKVIFQEYIINDANIPQDVKSFMQMNVGRTTRDFPGSEVRTLVNQGPKENRINLTILGDGYTAMEKAKFFEDAQRTTKNLFTGSTFASYLPLFNVYAVFTASAASGIGDGSPKNTIFKLYRDPAGSKRAIMPGDSYTAEQALKLAPATDYPIILANDNFYGGLGGRFAISTSSVRSGMIVLRHELGHNFGEVGEEYDGGYVYRGANSAGSNITWSHWADRGMKFFEVANLAGDYDWQNLNGHPYKQTFNFLNVPGAIFLAEISTVGWETPDDVITTIDNHRIKLEGDWHNDRNFYTVGPVQGLQPGPHTVQFTENIHDGDNVLAFSRLYAMPADYDFTPNRIAAFATFDDSGQKVGYRPTHNSCLMRNMMVPYFCAVDKENMWLKFLSRVTLVDGVTVVPVNPRTDAFGERNVTLAAPKLSGLTVSWYQLNGGAEVELAQYHGLGTWKAPAAMKGNYRVRVQFQTPEVRKYDKDFVATKDFSL